jgi:4-amino-4-deoxy-L-arabinose transferase-like glycosyltransferase
MVRSFHRSKLIAGSLTPEGALDSAAFRSSSASEGNPRGRRIGIWYGLCLVFAITTYFYALDSPHIPKNGDEYIYAHITRLTAYSGHLLPLQSQLPDMRNTKPPLLFWQGIASTHWAKNWSLLSLRYPSVIYTLLTTGLVFLLGWKVFGRLETGALGCLIYLSFFNTYRYGRPYLTDAPVTFWTFLPFFAFLIWQPVALESRVFMPLLFGLGLGVGLLYKSFALVIPVALAFSWWHLDYRGYRVAAFLRKDAGKIAILASISLALFSAWFLLDPKPIAVLQEFVLKENLGRLNPQGVHYLTQILKGVSSVWALALGYPVNAGLLVFEVLALFWVSVKRRRQFGEAEKLLWIWPVSLFVFFSLPSTRSSRYLLPAMPALALLCALNWDRISRKSFVASLLAALAALFGMAYLALRLQFSVGAVQLFPVTYWLLLGGTATLAFVALSAPEFTRPCVPCISLLVCLSLAVALRPLDGPLGCYAPDVQRYVMGKQVWVPCDFIAVDEGYRLLLPGADVHCYRDDGSATLESLATRYAIFAIRLPLKPDTTDDLRLIGERLELRGRPSSAELLDMLRGNVFDHLFVRERLVEVPRARPVALPQGE